MWTQDKSLNLSILLVKVLSVLIIVLALCVPVMVRWYDIVSPDRNGLLQGSIVIPLSICLYLSAICGEVCLYHLGKLLKNIKNDIIFKPENCRHLRYISWCCIFVAIPFGIFGFWRSLGFLVAFAAGFFGLVLRVLKNVFVRAVEIQEENDYTI